MHECAYVTTQGTAIIWDISIVLFPRQDSKFFLLGFEYNLINFKCMGVLPAHVCVCTICSPDTHRDWKRESDPLQLVLQTTVNHHMSTGNWTLIPCKRNKVVNHWVISPNPRFSVLCWTLQIHSWKSLIVF